MAYLIGGNYRKAFLFQLIFIRLIFGNSESIVATNDTETSVGATATLHCNSSNGNIEWHHLAVDRSVHEIVYQDGFIFNGYKERFVVTRYDSGECNLVIKNVKTTDAGKYTCVETSDVVVQKTGELIVFELYPSVQHCAAKFTCAPVCDALELTCRMKAHGNIIPSMEWRNSANGILTSNSNTENGITTSSIHPQTNSPTVQFYSCRVKYPTHSSATSQFSWSYSISVPASMDSTSSNEKVQSIEPGVIVIIAILSAALGAMAVGTLVLFLKNKRNKPKLVNATRSRNSDSINYKDIESSVTMENIHLLEPVSEDEAIKINGCVPRTPLNKNNSIHGIGILDNEVFLVTRDSGIIEVFDLESENFKRAWKVDGLINPNDMATCPTKGFVFICDWKKAGRRSEIICCDKNGKDKGRWTCENEKGRISITKETNVVIAEDFCNTINECTHFGGKIKKIETGREKPHIQQAIKLENENFVACFGDARDKVREICIINNEGTTINSINHSCLQIDAQFLVPRSLAVDKEGSICVCDVYNCRIILLTPDLQYKGKIDYEENGNRLRCPLRICYHESLKKSQIIVADDVKKDGEWKDGRILALNMRRPSRLALK